MPATYEGRADLVRFYERLRTLPADDINRIRVSGLSPLLLLMHTSEEIQAHAHVRLLDDVLTAFGECRLYADGPGPAPAVYGNGERILPTEAHPNPILSPEFHNAGDQLLVRPGTYTEVEEAAGLCFSDTAPADSRVLTRLAISMPPRHGKSVMVTKAFPQWFLLRYPTASVLVSTYNQDFADEWGQDVGDFMEEHVPHMPTASDGQPLALLSRTKKRLTVRPGKDRGTIAFKGAGLGITGMGWNLGIIDDPYKDDEEALSEPTRNRKGNWYVSSFRTRRTRNLGCPPPLEIQMFTRWHEDDLAGRFVYEEDGETPAEGWYVLWLPALAEPGETDPLHREPGEALCPQLTTRADLLDQQRADPTWFSCLYQGRPTHQQGGMFAKTADGDYHRFSETADHITLHGQHHPKEGFTWFVMCDLANSKKTTADWTVFTLWGWHQKTQTLVAYDRFRDRVSTETHANELRSFIARHPTKKLAFIGIENKTFGTNLINELRIADLGTPIVPVPADADKVSRAIPYAEGVRSGKVLFPPTEGPTARSWHTSWDNEHAKFPRTKHDDQVDTGSMAWSHVQNYRYSAPNNPSAPTDPGKPDHVRRGFEQLRRKNGRRQHDYQGLRSLLRG